MVIMIFRWSRNFPGNTVHAPSSTFRQPRKTVQTRALPTRSSPTVRARPLSSLISALPPTPHHPYRYSSRAQLPACWPPPCPTLPTARMQTRPARHSRLQDRPSGATTARVLVWLPVRTAGRAQCVGASIAPCVRRPELRQNDEPSIEVRCCFGQCDVRSVTVVRGVSCRTCARWYLLSK
jgi:hypothetical protein